MKPPASAVTRKEPRGTPDASNDVAQLARIEMSSSAALRGWRGCAMRVLRLGSGSECGRLARHSEQLTSLHPDVRLKTPSATLLREYSLMASG